MLNFALSFKDTKSAKFIDLIINKEIFPTFNEIYSDAFDSDFCTGLVYKTIFTNIKNDAIDFSGSKILLENCEVHNARSLA